MKRHWDIIYNYMVAEDGTVFEGTGWENRGEFSVGNLGYSIL